MDKQRNIEIAEDTLQIIKQKYYIKNGRKIHLDEYELIYGSCYDKVKVFSPEALQAIVRDDDELFEKAFYASGNCEFYLINADTFEVASSFQHGLAMNFASAKHPGGGFLKGANAQEESLCRCSTLYASIASEKAKIMYDYNKKSNLPCYSDYMLLSPDVIVFRDKDGDYLDKPFYTSVMTVAAPNMRREARYVPQDEIDSVIKERLRCFLMASAHEGYRDIVLGAWGCGAFGNNPFRVARCFYDLFFHESIREYFDHVAFAILGGGKNYQAFAEVFANEIDNCESDLNCNYDNPTFIEATKNAPVCNHSIQNLDKDNIGYTFGVLSDGTPFEADLWLDENNRNISFYMTEKEKLIVENNKDDTSSTLLTLTTQYACKWKSVLGIGMVERNIDSDNNELITYVDYIVENHIIKFSSRKYNGVLSYLTDVEGNNLVCISIALDIDGESVAHTGLRFRPFPNQPRTFRPISIISKRNS